MEPADDDFEDERSSGPLLPQEDRLWRHPSEFAAVRRVPSGVRAHHTGVIAVFAGLIGALAATGLVFATGGMRHTTERIPVVEQELAAPVVAGATASLATAAATIWPSCVTVAAHDDQGTHVTGGVIFRSDGMALTSAAALDGSDQLTATIDGARQVAARLIGVDPSSGLAVVKLAGDGYTPAPLGSALDLQVGDPVVAMYTSSNAPGDRGSITAVGDTVASPNGSLANMIQITTADVPQTVGGPVLDSRGAVVGIETALGPPGKPIAFATPVDSARRIASELMATGKVVPVWLGVKGHDVSTSQATALGVIGGAVIDTVFDGSPAQQAHLLAGDVIVAVDGHAVTSMATLIMAIQAWSAGTPVLLEVRRGSSDQIITATVGTRPASV